MAAVEMGEVDEIHSNEENIKDGVSVNGDVSDYKDEMDDENSNDVIHINSDGVVVEDSANESSDDEDNPCVQEEEDVDADCIIQEPDDPLGEEEEEDEDEVLESMDVQEIIHEDDDDDEEDSNEEEEEEIHEIVNSDEEDNNDVRINNSMSNGVDSSVEGTDVNEKSAVVTVNDSGEEVVMLDDDNNTDNVEEIDYNKQDTVEHVGDNKKDPIENGRGNDVAMTLANGTDIQTVDDDEDDDDVINLDDDTTNKDDDTTNKDDDTTNKDDDTTNKDDDTTNKDDDIINKGKKATDSEVAPRRSSRNLNKRKKKSNDEFEKIAKSKREEILSEESDIEEILPEESDIEEILPEDPLAVSVPSPDASQSDKLYITQSDRPSSSTIVVKDTKCLAEIATKSTANTSGNNSKKEPTLVIIDTNSILSGHGPVPITQKPPVSSSIPNSFTMLPMALPAQGIYPANMRATITPIPMTTSSQQSSKPSASQSSSQPVLPTLTDDMFVVEAPSFIVPYVYEKPPMKDLREFVKNLENEIEKLKKSGEKDDLDKNIKEGDKTNEDKQVIVGSKQNLNEKVNENTENKTEDKGDKDLPSMSVPSATTLAAELRKPSGTYFDSPLGKFFMGIGYSLVQEAVQTDLLKQQKRRRDREGGQNPETLKTINSLMKNLEHTKENNEPYHMPTKKCEFCSFKTESALAMAYHLETPHMKNYIYRCNFCAYEVRSPHDILFHMEVQHGVRGRLERAPAFHQCPSCPFEDNQKGKLSRHLVACARKFKPERNLEPPADYEPPAKIPRAPRMKQQGLGSAAAMYQAMARNSQYQMMAKVVPNMSALQRSRGRPTLGTNSVKSSGNVRPVPTSGGNMLYKQATMSGGSVLVPTSYQLSGNQLYQVLGGHEMGGHLGLGGAATILPSMPAASSNFISVQQQQQLSQSQQQSSTNKSKSHQQPSISITPLPRSSATTGVTITKPGDTNSKNSFVICEICDGYIKDLEQLRNHMQWIHKVKIHPKMIYNRPPLNCQKCQFRFFTDQGLERHLLGSHGLVTSSMQEAANKTKDAGRCPVCGRVYQWKLLNHVARDHNMTLKPAHLSYKCTVCTATFGMYKQFENHVYSAHSVVAKRVMDKKTTSTASGASSKSESILKPLKINDEITIIPQPAKPACNSGNDGNKEDGIPSTSRNSFSNGNSSTSKGFSSSSELRNELSSGTTLSSRSSRRKPTVQEDN